MDRRIKAGLRHRHHIGEAAQHLPALGGIQILHHAQQAGRDKQHPILHGHLVRVHGVDRRAQRSHDRRAVVQRAAARADPGSARIGCKAESVQFRHHLRADEFPRQHAEGHACRIRVVHMIHHEHTAPVKVAGHGLVGQAHAAAHIAAVPAVIRQPVHRHLGDYQLIGVCTGLHQLGTAIQHRRLAGLLVYLVQQGNKLFEQRNRIRHLFSSSFSCSSTVPFRRCCHA